jgi:ABC-type bacteriocin/lantibiotic exporter with double-glycine peptidase domain
LRLSFFATPVVIVALAVNAFAFQIEGVPFVKQEDQECGPAALASVLSFYGAPVGLASISQATYNQKLRGSLITDLEDFARRLGFQTVSSQGTVKNIKVLINQRRPVIVLVDLGFWIRSRPHYLVLYGYNKEGFIAHNGIKPSQLYTYSDFEKMWEKMGCPYLLVYR